MYVWSDTPDRYKDARIIFKDFESSNWSWDPVAKAYFWHRFYSHQPDLNFDEPLVHKNLFRVIDFWFSMGVDGLRLDAVPYLYEREGLTVRIFRNSQFPEKLRAHVDASFSNKMFLAEANQWPEDSVAYFGDGDECHMSFHFPLCHGCLWLYRWRTVSHSRYSAFYSTHTADLPVGAFSAQSR